MYTLKDLREGNVPPVLKPKDAMEMLNMGKYTFYGLIRAGKLPHLRYGTKILVPTNKLLDWLDEVC